MFRFFLVDIRIIVAVFNLQMEHQDNNMVEVFHIQTLAEQLEDFDNVVDHSNAYKSNQFIETKCIVEYNLIVISSTYFGAISLYLASREPIPL